MGKNKISFCLFVFLFIWFFCFSFFHRTQWKGRTKGASILTAISPAKPNCSDRELMSDLHSNKLGNIDYESMFADRKADALDDSDEERDAPHFNFVGSNPPPKPKYVWGVPHGCDITPELQRAARQQKERDKDDSKAGGDKFFFWCLFFGFFSLVFSCFLPFCGVDNGDVQKDGCFVAIFIFFWWWM